MTSWSAGQIDTLQFSPDSKLLGIGASTRVWAYNIHDRESVKAASGNIRGFSFSPDSTSIAFGTAGHNQSFDSPTDLYSFSIADKQRTRITRDRKSLNPLWTDRGIIHDRQRIRDNAAPSYNLFEIKPDGGSLRRITALTIPPLSSGLIPLELSENGKRLIAEFVGQDTSVGFAVNPKTGKVRALSRDSENGFVASDLTADGTTVLGGDRRRGPEQQAQRGDDALHGRQAEGARAARVRSGLEPLTARGVAVVQHQRVAVRVAEEGHVADAGVDRLRRELRRPWPRARPCAACTSSTRSASGFVVVWYSIPNASDCITAIVRLPVSNSAPGIFP